MMTLWALLLLRLSVGFAFVSFFPSKFNLKTQILRETNVLGDIIPVINFNTSFQSYQYLNRHFAGAESISVKKTNSGEVSFGVNTIFKGTPETIWKYYFEKKNSELHLSQAIIHNEDNISELFNNTAQFFDFEKAEILQLNHDFFKALASKDISTLRTIWLDSESCFCRLDRGRNLISSYKNIIGYFKTLSPENHQRELVNVDLNFMGEVAVVSCELWNLLDNNPKKLSRTFATNIFVKSHVSNRFHLFAHFASNFQTIRPMQSLFRDPTVLPPAPPAAPRSNMLDNIFGGMHHHHHDNDDSDDADDEVDEDELDSSLEFTAEDDTNANSDVDDHDESDDNDPKDIPFDRKNVQNSNLQDFISRNIDPRKRMIIPKKNGFVVLTPMIKGKVLPPSKEQLQQIVSDIFQTHNKQAATKLQNESENTNAKLFHFLQSVGKELINGISKDKQLSSKQIFKHLLPDVDGTSGTSIDDEGVEDSEDGDYEDSDEDDAEGEKISSSLEEQLQRERRLITAAAEALISWLELPHHEEVTVNKETSSEFSPALTSAEATSLRTKLISAVTHGTPSPLETSFALFLCCRKPKYLGGEMMLSVENIPRKKEHFRWLWKNHHDDFSDLVGMWKRIAAADILKDETAAEFI